MLDAATLRDILIGAVGSGLWSLGAWTGLKGFQVAQTFASGQNTTLKTALEGAARSFLESGSLGDEGQRMRLASYMRSPELESIVRQVFSNALVPQTEAATLQTIRAEFVTSLSLYLDVDPQRLAPFAIDFFASLVAAIQTVLALATEKGVLSAHEAQSAARQRVLLGEVANIQKNLELLTAGDRPDIDRILDFEQKYREQVAFVHSTIKPPNFDSGRRVPIDELFVAPRLARIKREKQSEPESVSFDDFCATLGRVVLLGNPGGGKSTMATKLCHSLASGPDRGPVLRRQLTPLLIILREFGSQKKTSICSIARFLSLQAASRYQLEPPPMAFEYLLLNGRALVIFDGLDELLETSFRQEITGNVEAFCKLYPAAPVLVTSREVGYEQAPLDERTFQLFRLAPFDDGQVCEYAHMWFGRDEDYAPEQRKQKAEAFVTESSLVPDLRGNPLMLGLMCNLYRVEGYIPKNRPEVYGKCSIMLFERWDKARDILVPLPFEEHIRPAMQDLAFWIYSDEALQGGVTEADLVDKTGRYLSQWVFDDSIKAKRAAEDFIGFCTGRAWVFTDTGTTGDGERLFQFTHRTFLEYFTASYLVSVYPTPEGLLGALRRRILRREWDVVAQLAFQIQSKQVHGASDVLLTGLLGSKATSTDEVGNVLSFAERSLEFLVPSPTVRKDLTQAAMEFWLGHTIQNAATPLRGRRDEPPAQHVGNLLSATTENLDTVAAGVEEFLVREISSQHEGKAALCSEMAIDLPHPLLRRAKRDIVAYWRGVSDRICDQVSARMVHLARTSMPLALRSYWRGSVSVVELVGWFGLGALFREQKSGALGDFFYYPLAHSLLDAVFPLTSEHPSEHQIEKTLNTLNSLAPVFEGTPTPWLTRSRAEVMDRSGHWRGLGWRRKEGDWHDRPLQLAHGAAFSVLCILGVELERLWADGLERFAQSPQEPSFPPLRLYFDVLMARFRPVGFEFSAAIDSFALGPGQIELIRKWCGRAVSFHSGAR